MTWNFCCGPGARKAQQPGNYTVTKKSREREKRRNERERARHLHDGDDSRRNQTTGITLPADMRMLREEPVGLFLHVSGKGWRQKVPELYQKPSRKDESEAGEEEAAEE